MAYRYRSGAIKIIFDGQSFNFAPTLEEAYPAQLMALLPGLYRKEDVSRGGTPYVNRAASAAARVDGRIPIADRCVLLDNGGQTDIWQSGMNLTAAQTIADMESYWDARRTAGCDLIIGFTVTKSTVYDADGETQRQSLNSSILSSTHLDAVADIAALAHAQDPSNTTYFYDGLHPTAVFAGEMAATAEAAMASLGLPT